MWVGHSCATPFHCWSTTGPVLSQYDQFLLIRPCAEGGPALRLLTKVNLHFLSKLLVYRASPGPSVLQVTLRDETVLTFFKRSLKIQYKLDLLPPSKYTKTLLYNHLGIQMKLMRSLKMS